MRDDQLAADYLGRLRRAARTMPRARRRELLGTLVWPFGYAGVLYGIMVASAFINAGSFCGYGCTSTSQGGACRCGYRSSSWWPLSSYRSPGPSGSCCEPGGCRTRPKA
jgi:hypothetical protein